MADQTPTRDFVHCVTCAQPLPKKKEQPYYFPSSNTCWQPGSEIDWAAEDVWETCKHMKTISAVIRSLSTVRDLSREETHDLIEPGYYLDQIHSLSLLLNELEAAADHNIKRLLHWVHQEEKEAEEVA